MSNSNKDFTNLQKYLNDISLKLSQKELRVVLTTAGNLAKNVIEDSFLDERDPYTNKKWSALKQSTKLKKAKSNKSNKILRDSGSLADNWALKNIPFGVEVYNNKARKKSFSYGMSHQFGSNNLFGKGIKLEARPFLPIDKSGKIMPKLQEDIIKVVDDYVKKVILK